MEENLCRQNEDLHCDVLFTRLIQDWELESLQSFYSLLYSVNISQNGEDRMVWLPARNGSFKDKLSYKVLTARGSCAFPWKSIRKVTFFTWTVASERSSHWITCRRGIFLLLTVAAHVRIVGIDGSPPSSLFLCL